MAILSGIARSYLHEIINGVHAADDDYKIALFTNAANLSPETTSYAGQPGEVAGGGYRRGGQSLEDRSCGLSGNVAYMTFADPRWSAASITAHGALIYNASKQNRAVAVLNFGGDHTSTNGEFVISLPPAGTKAIVTVA